MVNLDRDPLWYAGVRDYWFSVYENLQTGGITRMGKSSLQVAIIMGSQSDWDTMQVASETLTLLHITHESRVFSAQRIPDALREYMSQAENRGVQVFIAGGGGAAQLAGVIATKTQWPVLGVPLQSKVLQGLDSLLSIVQMPKGIPVGTLAIGSAGAANAGLMAAAILALTDSALSTRLQAYRENQTRAVLEDRLPG
jgi:5-(carboxyamino)imidazole ribonucleotide mutase